MWYQMLKLALKRKMCHAIQFCEDQCVRNILIIKIFKKDLWKSRVRGDVCVCVHE